MYFSSFLVLDKRTQTVRLNLPNNFRQARFAGAVELSARAIEQLYGRVTHLNSENQTGVLISQQMDTSGSYLLYLEPNNQLDEKYRAFMQRVMVSICGCICFSERINYNRMAKRPGQTELPDQSAYFITEKSDEVEAYKIKSLGDNRLEVGMKLPKDQIKALSCAEQEKNNQVVRAFLTELEVALQNRSSFVNMMNLNDPYEDICKALSMKAEVEGFQRDVLSTTHGLLSKTQIDRLCQSVESICYRHSNSRALVGSIVQSFRKQMSREQQGYLKEMLAELAEQLKKNSPITYSELNDTVQVQSKLLDSKLSVFVDSSQQLSQLALFQFYQQQSNRLFSQLYDQLFEEQETKRCLTEEIYEQIQLSDRLKLELDTAKARLQDLEDFDRKLAEKNQELDSCRKQLIVANQQLSTTKEAKRKLEEDVNGMIQSLVECSLEKGRAVATLQEREIALKDLQQQCKTLKGRLDKLNDDARHQSKQLNSASSSLQASFSQNRDLMNVVGRYKSVVQDFQSNLQHLHQSETRKTNHILQVNMRAYEKVRTRARELEISHGQLTEKVEQLTNCNNDLTNRLIYYEKLYRLKCQSPYGMLERSPSSAFDNRINQSVSDMIIFEQNDENDTSDRLERKKQVQQEVQQLNETFDYRNPTENGEVQQPRRSEGCLDQCPSTLVKKKVLLIRPDRSDWDLNSSARQSEHRLDLTPQTVAPSCKAKYF